MRTDGEFREDPSRGGLWVKPAYSMRDVVVRDEQGQILYAVVGLYGKMPRPKWTEIRYLSASSQEEAVLRFRQYHWIIPQFSEIVAGPAIGFFVHDNHGDSLSSSGARPDPHPLDRGTEFEEQGRAA